MPIRMPSQLSSLPARPLKTPLLPAAMLLACSGVLAAPTSATGVTAEGGSRITQVKVYPGSATVERTARVPAGARSLTIRCLSPQLDVQSLQVQADAHVRIGESSVKVQDRDLDKECATPLDDQVRDAEDRVAASKAETDSLELATSYLRTVATVPPSEPHSGPGTPGSAAINSTTDTLRRSSQDLLLKLHQSKRRQEAAELALKELTEERNRIAGPKARTSTVTITLASDREGELRLSYQLRGPGWSPSYRAALDSTSGVVKFERLALVAQNTGEDWRNVQLALSTGQPTRSTAGRLPGPWTINVAPAQQFTTEMRATPAPAPMAASKVTLMSMGDAGAESMPAMPSFDVQVSDDAYATEFTVPQRITVPSGGQRITLSLGSLDARAQLVSRTSPGVEPAAYLIAQLSALPGVWPTAPVALYRDGAYVGQGRLDNNSDELSRTGLSFGRDERVVVTAEPQQQNSGSAGFTGANVERKVQHAYRVENRHQRPIALQVLDAAPVSQNEQIDVVSQYDPLPADKAWNRRPGLILWSETLAPGSSLRFTAAHTLRYPKDARLQESK
ncbi:MAG: DUF4139 domain-containing protein [Burkholderiaceae bacterium]|nr:DUF4139 domain-containing protein [Burkholderiaceae bacterium]